LPDRFYAVNPRYETTGDLKCYPPLFELREPVDAAFLAVPSSGGPNPVEEAGKCGIPYIVHQRQWLC